MNSVLPAAEVTGRVRYFPGSFIYHLTRDPLGFLTELHARHGSYVAIRSGSRRLYLAIEPEIVRQVLVTEGHSFAKSRGLEVARTILGNGLLTSHGALHIRQRRLVQPAFHRQRLEKYAEVMVRVTAERSERWKAGQCLELARELMTITLEVITQTMFGEAVGEHAQAVEQALNEAVDRFRVGLIPFLPLLEKLPLPSSLRFERARRRLDEVLLGLIRKRREAAEDRGDLLSMLLAAADQDGGMSDQQLRDEAMTIFLAGHETTANALAWTLALLMRHPLVLEQLQQEIDGVLGSRPARLEDVAQLEWCRQVLQEGMRLYPPAWLLGRQAREATRIGGEPIEPGSVFLMSQWVAHRQPRYFPHPDEFRPERWLQEPPKFAYFPFGGGNRVCIGEGFARTEAVLILATLLQRWRFIPLAAELPPPAPRITLRLQGGLPVRLQARQGETLRSGVAASS